MGEVSGLPGSVEDLIDDFELFDDWEDRYAYLVDLGKRLPALPEEERTEQAKVQGCTSQVWFVRRPSEDGRLRWDGDSDASIVRGLVAVLHVLFDGLTPGEAHALDVEAIFGRIGLERHLSVNRRNGFYAMVGRLRSWA
ncbi:MAG: SufE family protein [Myxococcales bacterium]|nr:SufE family protein [Myxococcales bacterium]